MTFLGLAVEPLSDEFGYGFDGKAVYVYLAVYRLWIVDRLTFSFLNGSNDRMRRTLVRSWMTKICRNLGWWIE